MKDTGILGAVVAGLFGLVVGFAVGCLYVAVLIPFSDPHGTARNWAPDIALLFGVGGAFVGGPVGILTGAIFGFRATLKGAATRGVLVGLAGIVVGFLAGFLLSGLRDRQWSLVTENSTICGLLGGTVGIIAGTYFGARKYHQGRPPITASAESRNPSHDS